MTRHTSAGKCFIVDVESLQTTGTCPSADVSDGHALSTRTLHSSMPNWVVFMDRLRGRTEMNLRIFNQKSDQKSFLNTLHEVRVSRLSNLAFF